MSNPVKKLDLNTYLPVSIVIITGYQFTNAVINSGCEQSMKSDDNMIMTVFEVPVIKD